MTVYLVGAGPGDPGLVTRRAHDLLTACDCVVYDYLVNPEILATCPASAARHFVGKRGHAESTTQEAINRLLVDLAGKHRCVVRLKGGDPFLFGRGGEEAQALHAVGIRFEVVPGVTAGVAVPAYAGIPVTHRAASSAVAFATGHERPGKESALDWSALARIETLVLYMGMHRLDESCRALIAHGRPAETPAAVVQWGTYAHQRTVTGTLTTLPGLAHAAGLGAPAITVIGEVVRWREHCAWFEQRPLHGRTVLVTRGREQSSALASALREHGAAVVELPLARYEAADPAALDAELDRLDQFDWTTFTSANSVRFLFDRLHALKRDARAFGRCRLAAVGPATAEALAQRGLVADLVPDDHSANGLATCLLTAGVGRVLLPQADNAEPALRDALIAGGCTVTTVTTYRSLDVAGLVLPPQQLDAVAFASSASAARFARVAGDTLADLISGGCRFYAIGAQTAAGMATIGLPCHGIAAHASAASLAQCIADNLGPTAG